ncbi:hypothetical protein IWX49DRAFT_48323 [Phyllosticta citricarpa]|uniref:Uncharacterized protein n=2 Tax=Phyllosticta TaxID=121621 RepID=A0ABR1MGM4_9PEZI
MSSWLQKQRKAELASLAEEAGLTGYEGLLKEELVFALDEHLKDNSTRLNGHSAFAEYYGRNGSPVKRSRADQDIEPRSTRPRRRVTRIKEEVDSDDNASPLAKIEERPVATRTPRSFQRVAERIPLPPSPAVVTNVIENQTAVVRNRLGDVWTNSGITEKIQYVREALSSVVGVESAVILLEAFYLQKQVMQWQYAFDIPAFGFLGSTSQPVFFPNLFALLTGEFWGPLLLWASTSLFIPLFFAYFFNFTLQSGGPHDATRSSYQTDPLSFNVAKALISYLVYSQGIRFAGLVGEFSADVVKGALPGGTNGVLIGAGIGALASMYEAALRR